MCIIIDANYTIELNKKGIGTGIKLTLLNLNTKKHEPLYFGGEYIIGKYISFRPEIRGVSGFSVFIADIKKDKKDIWEWLVSKEERHTGLNSGKELLMWEVKFKGLVAQGYWRDNPDFRMVQVQHLLFRKIIKRHVFKFNKHLYK